MKYYPFSRVIFTILTACFSVDLDDSAAHTKSY